jgi:hypothetical protein
LLIFKVLIFRRVLVSEFPENLQKAIKIDDVSAQFGAQSKNKV